jgi:hypothetical protein
VQQLNQGAVHLCLASAKTESRAVADTGEGCLSPKSAPPHLS